MGGREFAARAANPAMTAVVNVRQPALWTEGLGKCHKVLSPIAKTVNVEASSLRPDRGAWPVRLWLARRFERFRRQGQRQICRAPGRDDLWRCLEADQRRQLVERCQAVRRGRAPAPLFG